MNQIPKEWLDFLREQYPVGSRIKLREMGTDEPDPVPPGSIGTLTSIDGQGTFHIKWDNGRDLGLVIGQDRFSILPPETTLLKLYMPLTADRTRRGRDNPTKLMGRDLLRYEGVIREALRDNQHPDEAERGIMNWYGKEDTVNQKVKSVIFTVETRDDELWGVAECRVFRLLTPEEMVTLTDYIGSQASDGWGEGFEQRTIRVREDNLNVHLWNFDDWSIMTEEERFDPEFFHKLPDLCWTVNQSDGRLVCIKRGEEGYFPSQWDTGDAEKNRRIADYNNEKRGITPAQEQAMVCGSMFGWSSPGTDPQRYEQWGPEIGGM